MVHLYYGYGKGKTTAAAGIALRMLGHSGRVVFCQFMKDGSSGEVVALGRLEGCTCLSAPETRRFTWNMASEDRKISAKIISSLFEAALARAASQRADMLVLDELVGRISAGYLDEEKVLSRLDGIRDLCEIVITGHAPSERMTAFCDYVTHMEKEKHPFDLGQDAREGIEY